MKLTKKKYSANNIDDPSERLDDVEIYGYQEKTNRGSQLQIPPRNRIDSDRLPDSKHASP